MVTKWSPCQLMLQKHQFHQKGNTNLVIQGYVLLLKGLICSKESQAYQSQEDASVAAKKGTGQRSAFSLIVLASRFQCRRLDHYEGLLCSSLVVGPSYVEYTHSGFLYIYVESVQVAIFLNVLSVCLNVVASYCIYLWLML